ncbi:hypothetical protein ACFHW2_03070 [Actinomadura sp. LOL_016]|uniref:hypothetical protein n=1 Tax=unclassified Actinomadura TaxID=2626254 RepID=UPI003A7FD44E
MELFATPSTRAERRSDGSTVLLDACDGLVADAVLTGQDRDYVGALLWLDPARARSLAGEGERPAESAAVRAALADALRRSGAGGGSRRVARALVLEAPASLADGELTDKGYVNQRGVLDRRAGLVELLYGDPVAGPVIVPAERHSTKHRRTVSAM